jgi:hypothetical protein
VVVWYRWVLGSGSRGIWWRAALRAHAHVRGRRGTGRGRGPLRGPGRSDGVFFRFFRRFDFVRDAGAGRVPVAVGSAYLRVETVQGWRKIGYYCQFVMCIVSSVRVAP